MFDSIGSYVSDGSKVARLSGINMEIIENNAESSTHQIKSTTRRPSNKQQHIVAIYLQYELCLQSLVLTFKPHESREHSLDHLIRVCVVTYALASAMITPASGKASPIVCFI